MLIQSKEDYNLILCFIVHKCNKDILDFFIDKIKGWYKYYQIDFETDAEGHVVDANHTIDTRTLTRDDLGYTGSPSPDKYTKWKLVNQFPNIVMQKLCTLIYQIK